MMILCTVYMFACILFVSYVSTATSPLLIGPYKINMKSAEKCKNESEAIFGLEMVWIKNDQQKDMVMTRIHIPRRIGPVAGEIFGWRKIGEKYVQFFRIGTRTICDWLHVGAVVSPTPEARCFMRPGTLTFNVTDPDKATHIFVGKYMLYGKYKARVKMTFGKHLLGCGDFSAEIISL